MIDVTRAEGIFADAVLGLVRNEGFLQAILRRMTHL